MVVRQSLVFQIEERSAASGVEFPAGHNYSVYGNMENPNFANPVKDYVSLIHSWLDIVKRGVLISLMWVTLSIMFLAGTERTNLFSLGYLIGAFVFLWQGSDFYLRPVKTILKWWNLLIWYNIVVIFSKALLQGVGCVLIKQVTPRSIVFANFIECISNLTNEIITAARAGVSADSTVRHNLSEKIPEFRQRYNPGEIRLRGATGGHRDGLGRAVLRLLALPETAVQELLLLPHSGRNEGYERAGVERRGAAGGTAPETHRDPGERREERAAEAEV